MQFAQRAQYRRWAASKSPNFVARMVDELSRRKCDVVRIHDSGDFYTLAYILKWWEIAKAFPGRTFLAYTKMVPTFKTLETNGQYAPDNIKVIYSMGGKWDGLICRDKDNHSRVFPNLQELKQAGYKQSPDYLPLSFHEANTREGFVYHGNKKWENCMRDLDVSMAAR